MQEVTRFIKHPLVFFTISVLAIAKIPQKVRCIIQNPNRVIDGIVVDEKQGVFLVFSYKSNYYLVNRDFCEKRD